MQNTLINQDFERTVKQLRRILPKLSFGLLIATYLTSAIIMGISHSQNTNQLGLKIAAFLIALAIQTGRGALVFFFQLNPAHIRSRFSMGFIAATVLLGLSLLETWLVIYPFGLSWTVSVSTLMLIGWVLEIMILKETLFATEMELYQNKDQWLDLYQFYIARSEFRQFVTDLHAGKQPKLPESISAINPEEETPLKEVPEKELPVEGKEVSPALNGQTL